MNKEEREKLKNRINEFDSLKYLKELIKEDVKKLEAEIESV